jgi:hypothetical protein
MTDEAEAAGLSVEVEVLDAPARSFPFADLDDDGDADWLLLGALDGSVATLLGR